MSTNGQATSGVGLPRGRELDMPRLQAEDRDVLRGEPGAGPVAGPDDTSTLARSVELRFPDLTQIENARERAEALQDHIVATAIVRGELAELRLRAHVSLQEALKSWRKIDTRTARTGPQMEDVRRRQRPDLAELIDEAKWTIARCTEEMDRHGGTDYDAASRAYTILSGA